MAWNYMPDHVYTDSRGRQYFHCKQCTSSSCLGPGGTNNSNGSMCGNAGTDANTESNPSLPSYGEAPFYASAFNKIWYNPDITYSPAVDSAGVSMGNINATAAPTDKFLNAATTNLVANFQEVVYCNRNAQTGDLTSTARCRYQGRHNVGPFAGAAAPTYFLYYNNTVATNIGYPTTAFFQKELVTTSNPHYYNITPHEWCSDASLTNCALATAAGTSPGGTMVYPATIRYCKTAADATSTLAISGTAGAPAAPRCRDKFNFNDGFIYPRFGRFTRVDIVSTTGTYPKSANSVRNDCASATSCSYTEELQNFANWWSYYRFRLTLMKTSTGRAFLMLDDRYRVGFITINPNNPVTASKFLGVGKFDTTQRSAWYTKLYAQTTNGSTPNREALSRVGRYYAGVTSGINAQMTPDPLEYSCQPNYALLTTDGYWNGNPGQTVGGGAVGNQDGANSGYSTRDVGAYDGGLGVSDSLADVAMYYYKTDLRTTGTKADNNVPTNAKDTAAHQHMVTFTLGLGLEGLMEFDPQYETATSIQPPNPDPTKPPPKPSDFFKIKSAASNVCSWTTGTCNWPVPAQNDPSALDDLWHAAVNGRGTYFSASDPNSLAVGLQSALSKLKVQTAAAAASATSSPNITQTDNFIYSSTFRTAAWDGEVTAQKIDPNTGNILPAVVWSAQAKLDAAGSRTIYTYTAGAGQKLFLYANLTATEKLLFDNKCATWTQCILLTTSQKATANDGSKLVNWLRGERVNEAFSDPETMPPFRKREHLLGDTVNSTPAYARVPFFGYVDVVSQTYDDFKIAMAGRPGMLYVASNDGMLHAFAGDSGDEAWAYVPRIVMPKLAALADSNWNINHKFTVDGSPVLQDVYDRSGNRWRTILIAGLNSGGRGYYAMDVTNPTSPVVLWEFCNDPTVCTVSDADLGYTYGNAVMTKRNVGAPDGRWVAYVTSGINNVAPGDGKGYLYELDIFSGSIISKTTTGFGSMTAPSGMNRIAGWADSPYTNNTSKWIYGGDLWGNVWRFDTSTTPPTASKLAQLFDASGRPQSITTRPELAFVDGETVVYIGTGRYLGVEDLKDPATLVPPWPFAYNNTMYAIKDKHDGSTYSNFRSGNVVQNTLSGGGVSRTTSQNQVYWSVKTKWKGTGAPPTSFHDGWFVDLNPGNSSPGERVNIDPQLFLGTLAFVGNVPNNNVCTVGGDAWVYFLDYRNGTSVAVAAGGVAGTKVTGQTIVGFVVYQYGTDPTPSSGSGGGGGGGGGGGAGSGAGGAGAGTAKFKCSYTGATGEKIFFECPIAGEGGTARRINWRSLMNRR
jgi:type IV pilus assembly protein PilY1